MWNKFWPHLSSLFIPAILGGGCFSPRVQPPMWSWCLPFIMFSCVKCLYNSHNDWKIHRLHGLSQLLFRVIIIIALFSGSLKRPRRNHREGGTFIWHHQSCRTLWCHSGSSHCWRVWGPVWCCHHVHVEHWSQLPHTWGIQSRYQTSALVDQARWPSSSLFYCEVWHSYSWRVQSRSWNLYWIRLSMEFVCAKDACKLSCRKNIVLRHTRVSYSW